MQNTHLVNHHGYKLYTGQVQHYSRDGEYTGWYWVYSVDRVNWTISAKNLIAQQKKLRKIFSRFAVV